MQAWLQNLIAAYNNLHDHDLPALIGLPVVDVSTPTGPTQLTISVASYQYLTIHWGGPQKNPRMIIHKLGTWTVS
ncbi:MAG: hypothetical protein RMN51_09660 [Verrucomicrobiota bacterium]|nr:hypothetical protein [Limisphaera sp.]MDW8382357.1 hypothetical protein [Verrucomicrobiota bacterium]